MTSRKEALELEINDLKRLRFSTGTHTVSNEPAWQAEYKRLDGLISETEQELARIRNENEE